MKQKPRPLTAEEMRVLERFVRFEITLNELLVNRHSTLKFKFTPGRRNRNLSCRNQECVSQ
jgi:hypothetical protein